MAIGFKNTHKNTVLKNTQPYRRMEKRFWSVYKDLHWFKDEAIPDMTKVGPEGPTYYLIPQNRL